MREASEINLALMNVSYRMSYFFVKYIDKTYTFI